MRSGKIMSDLNVTLFQTELVWEDVEANLTAFQAKIDSISNSTDLLVLPEMFSTGFTMNAEALAQKMDGRAVQWMKQIAADGAVHIIGSLIIGSKDRFYNRLIWAQPDGQIYTYDKRHLFRMMGEEKVYSPGNQRITVDLKGWKIRPFVCYDLRFPVWTRNTNSDYDVAIFIANWPAKRALHWTSLLRARAIENLSYVIGVNRVGTDGNGIYFKGDSAVVDPMGNYIFQKSEAAWIETVELSYDLMAEYRQEFPAWKDADHFQINP